MNQLELLQRIHMEVDMMDDELKNNPSETLQKRRDLLHMAFKEVKRVQARLNRIQKAYTQND